MVLMLSIGLPDSYAQMEYDINGDSLMNRSNIKGPLEFKGHVLELAKKLKGANVVLYLSPDGSHDNMTEIFRTVTPGSGEFTFKLEVNKFYVLSVEKGGYTTKMVDFDTDVTLAREQYTTVPLFEFEVDMVPDDGQPYAGSVASVFYQIKRNAFDYQLDYSKEEMEDEERQLRERQEKERLAKLAYEKKKELEEAAKLLLEKENATAQQIIEAAIKVGDGDKAKTVKGFLEVFSEVDTLREKKADAMYLQLVEERKQSQATGTKINFQSIFDAAQLLEEKVVKEAEEKRSAQVAVLRAEQEAAEKKSKEAMELAKKAIEVEESERLAAAISADEARRKEEEIEKHDKVYYAIFNVPDRETAIQNLIKTYPKSDQYKEEKANAIYEAYEKERLTGTTLSNMDFKKLFAAADLAEQKAIKEDIDKDNKKNEDVLIQFQKQVEERKRKEQKDVTEKIIKGLADAPADKASQIAAFKDALPKNATYKDEKAEAMYEQYISQKNALPEIERALKAAPDNKEAQIKAVYDALPANTQDRQGTAERIQEEYVKSKQAQGGTGAVKMDFGSLFMAAEIAEETAKQEEKEQNAIEKRKALDQLEARREDIREQKREMAVQAEKQVEEIHRQGLAEAKNKKEKQLAEAIENGGGDRDKTVGAIEKVLPSTDDKELDRERAEAVYDSYITQSEDIRKSGNLGKKVDFASLFDAAQKAELAHLENQYEKKQFEEQEKLAKYEEERTEKAIEIAKAEAKEAEREAERADIAYEEALHKVEVQRQERLAEEKKREEELAKKLAMEQAQRKAQEDEIDAAELKRVQDQQQAEADRKTKEAQALADAETARLKKEQELAAEAARKQLAELEKQRKEAELADQRRQEQLEKERLAQEVADAKAADEARKAADRKQRELEDEQKRKAIEEAKLAEQERLAELKRKEDEEKARKAAELAALKAEEDAKIAEQKRLEEIARQNAEQAEAARKANYDKLMSAADKAVAEKDFRTALANYKDAQAIYPDDKLAAKKIEESSVEVRRIEKEEKEQLALDNRYSTLISEAQQELAAENYDAAKAKFGKASELKPDEQDPKQQIRNIERKQKELADAEEVLRQNERKYVLTMQEGAKALESGQLDLARTKYQEAASLKPGETEPAAKLNEVAQREEEVAIAKEKDEKRKDEARKEFERKQEEEKQRLADEAARKQREDEERKKALADVESTKQQQQLTAAELEKKRIEEYERLREKLEASKSDKDQARNEFLSELAKIYPQGLTEEEVQGKNFVLHRHVINDNNVVTIYEKKTWDWGGIFYFKNADIAITEAIYKLEIGKY